VTITQHAALVRIEYMELTFAPYMQWIFSDHSVRSKYGAYFFAPYMR
jgi:hypothetical protein